MKLGDLPADVFLKALREEVKKQSEHDKYKVATLIMSIFSNALIETYNKKIEENKK